MHTTINHKTIALIAHDARKSDMIQWVIFNAATLLKNKLVCTGTTGGLIEKALAETVGSDYESNVTKMLSGPMGGDAQIAAMVVEKKIDHFYTLGNKYAPVDPTYKKFKR